MTFVLCCVACALSEFLCYKFIKNLDKKERKKLQKWEDQYIFSRKEDIDRYLEMQQSKREEQAKKEEAKKKEEKKKK